MKTTLRKVISGGQTGADIAGVVAAKVCGFQTGGNMPAGFRTLNGNRPEYKKLFGMKETASYGYPYRTECNVRESDGTLILASVLDSPGELLTKNLIRKHGKPSIICDVKHSWNVQECLDFITVNKIEVLNVAGNSEQTSSGIFYYAFECLVDLFSRLKGIT